VYQADGSTALTDPENSIYIGYNAKGKDNNDNNSIVIGYNAIGLGANTVVLGNDSIVTTALKGTVGIGTTQPISSSNNKLDIYGSSTLTNMTISTADFATGNLMSGVVSSGTQGFVDLSLNAYWDGSAWTKRNTSYNSWIMGLSNNTDTTGRLEFVYSAPGTGFTMMKPLTLYKDYLRLGNSGSSYDMDIIPSGLSSADGYTSAIFRPTGGSSSYPNARVIIDSNYSSAINSGFEMWVNSSVYGKITASTNQSYALLLDAFNASATTSAFMRFRFSSSNTERFRFRGDGTGYADVSWTTFSPYLSYNYTEDGKTKADYKLGQIVSQKKNDRWSVTQSSSMENVIYGVVVLPEGFVSIPKELKSTVWNGTDSLEENDYVIPVAHLGEASTMVTVKAGENIREGDPISISKYSGIGGKATITGQVLGRALESTSVWDRSSCKPVSSIESIQWPEDDGSNSNKPCFVLPNGDIVGKIMVFVNVSWYDPKEISTTSNITTPGWYRISQLNEYDDHSNIKINNTSIGSSQNIVLSIDSTLNNQNINVVSNLTTGGYDITKARINNKNGIKYLEIYIPEVNENKISVKITESSNWIATDIVQITEEVNNVQEYALSGILFGISDKLEVEEDNVKIAGDLLSLSVNSSIGDSANRWNDIYAKGTIRLGSGADGEGAIRFNVQTKTLEFSNNGVEWLSVGDLSSQMTISPEYAGAILFADGSDNSGIMTSDAIEESGSFKNYYEWVSNKDTPQDYDILVRITLPTDFLSWKEDAIYLDIMTENSVSTDNNSVGLSLIGNSGTDVQITGGISKIAGTWERMSIKGADITQCNSAGGTCTLRISLTSSMEYFTRVGDITLNYNRSL